LNGDGEDDKADLLVVSAQQGEVYSGGAMVRRMVPVLFVGLEEKGEERRWRREEGENRCNAPLLQTCLINLIAKIRGNKNFFFRLI
jgi:hypothetical protein